MATITRAAEYATVGLGVSNGDHSFYLTDESPSYETDDGSMIDTARQDPRLAVDAAVPEPAAEPAAFVYNQEGTE